MRFAALHLPHEKSYPRVQGEPADGSFPHQLNVYGDLAAGQKALEGKGCENLTPG
jgi:hypothetical protein